MPRTWSLHEQSHVIMLFERLGALQTGHFRYTSGLHGEVYVAKDLIYPSVLDFSTMAEAIAREFQDELIDTVVGIAPIANTLAFLTALSLEVETGRPCFAIAAEKKPRLSDPIMSGSHIGERLYLSDKIVIRDSFQRFADSMTHVLITEDVINTGKSVKQLVAVLRGLGVVNISVGCLWNRGGITAEFLDVDNLFSLCDVQYAAYEPDDCKLCQEGVPKRTDFGHF